MLKTTTNHNNNTWKVVLFLSLFTFKFHAYVIGIRKLICMQT